MPNKSLFSIENQDLENSTVKEKEIFSIISLPFPQKREANPFFGEEEPTEMSWSGQPTTPNKILESADIVAVTNILFTAEPISETFMEEDDLYIPQMEMPKESIFSEESYRQYAIYSSTDYMMEEVDNEEDTISLDEKHIDNSVEKEANLELIPSLSIEKEGIEMESVDFSDLLEEGQGNLELPSSLLIEKADAGVDSADFFDLLEGEEETLDIIPSLSIDKLDIEVDVTDFSDLLQEEEVNILPEIPLLEMQNLAKENLKFEAEEKEAAFLRESQAEKVDLEVNTVLFQKRNRRFSIKVSEEEMAKYFQKDKFAQEAAENHSGKGKVDSIIEKFLLEQPQLKRPNMNGDMPILQQEEEEVAEPEIVTETMAKLYLLQGNKTAAIEIYEKLCLVFPEKITYFAEQIRIISNKV